VSAELVSKFLNGKSREAGLAEEPTGFRAVFTTADPEMK
jgi:hypothetical protein